MSVKESLVPYSVHNWKKVTIAKMAFLLWRNRFQLIFAGHTRRKRVSRMRGTLHWKPYRRS
jgi:hypothetical protein